VIGKLLVGFAAKAAQKDAPAFAARIKAVVTVALRLEVLAAEIDMAVSRKPAQ
jgi:hypothetical protein